MSSISYQINKRQIQSKKQSLGFLWATLAGSSTFLQKKQQIMQHSRTNLS